MKKELLLIGITAFLIMDTYRDGRYTEKIIGAKKYFKMATYGFVGLSLYVFMKKYPTKAQGMMHNITEIARYMPVDSNTKDILTPLFDLTNGRNNLYSKIDTFKNLTNIKQKPQFNRMLNSGMGATKRSVSETKKKYVAAQQNWKCGDCKNMLSASFEVDHKIDLQFGGSNHVSNLVALCRNCHGEKTMQHRLV